MLQLKGFTAFTAARVGVQYLWPPHLYYGYVLFNDQNYGEGITSVINVCSSLILRMHNIIQHYNNIQRIITHLVTRGRISIANHSHLYLVVVRVCMLQVQVSSKLILITYAMHTEFFIQHSINYHVIYALLHKICWQLSFSTRINPKFPKLKVILLPLIMSLLDWCTVFLYDIDSCISFPMSCV